MNGYGLVLGKSTRKDIFRNSLPGIKAYGWLSTHAKLKAKVISMIKAKLPDSSDITIENVMAILEEDLLNHDYDQDRAYNESLDLEMSIENYILSRVKFALYAYNAKQMKQNKIEKKTKDENTTEYYRVISLDAIVKNSSNSTTLQDMIPDDSADQLEAVLYNSAIDNLVERITSFSERTDTNVNVIIYATTCLSQWCDCAYNEGYVLQLILQNLGFTNYASMKELAHDEEFIEIINNAANVTDKVRLIQQLAKNIFCVKEITAVVQYIASEINAGRI